MQGAKVVKLVQRCIADVVRHPVEHVDIYLGDDLTTWHVALHYPEAAPFCGGPGLTLQASGFTLYAGLHFTEEFPAKPPRLKFLSPWIIHQHLWGDRVCHSLLSDDFLDYFRERRTHGTSMWNASCALADGEGLGGMPRYLQVLWEFLASDTDYEDEQHVRYDAAALQEAVEAQRAFCPDWLAVECRLETAAVIEAAKSSVSSSGGAQEDAGETAKEDSGNSVGREPPWGTDFFLKGPLIPGDPETHPCFDVAVMPGRVPSLSTTMTSLCKRSFDLDARTTDFGTPIAVALPFPCSREAWAAAGSVLAMAALQELAPVAEGHYRLQLPGHGPEAVKLESILGVVGELWKTTCIGIVKDDGYESERAMSCFLTLHFLLLCLAEEHPGLREYAASTVREFLALIDQKPAENLKAFVPDLGRFLVRFLLTEGEAPLRLGAPALVRELFSRNARWVRPGFWAEVDASEEEKAEQVEGTFEASHFGMKLTAFQSYYILRSAELGLDTLPALEACAGRPAAEALRTFQGDCSAIKEMGSYPEFFLWLQLDDLADADIHAMLCDAVADADARGYNAGAPR